MRTSDPEGVRRLPVGVVVILRWSSPDRAAELLAPGVIQEHSVRDDRHRFAEKWRHRVRKLFWMPMSTGESFISFSNALADCELHPQDGRSCRT